MMWPIQSAGYSTAREAVCCIAINDVLGPSVVVTVVEVDRSYSPEIGNVSFTVVYNGPSNV